MDPKEKLPCGIFTYDGDVHPIVAEVGSQFPDEDETNMAQHENDEFLVIICLFGKVTDLRRPQKIRLNLSIIEFDIPIQPLF